MTIFQYLKTFTILILILFYRAGTLPRLTILILEFLPHQPEPAPDSLAGDGQRNDSVLEPASDLPARTPDEPARRLRADLLFRDDLFELFYDFDHAPSI